MYASRAFTDPILMLHILFLETLIIHSSALRYGAISGFMPGNQRLFTNKPMDTRLNKANRELYS